MVTSIRNEERIPKDVVEDRNSLHDNVLESIFDLSASKQQLLELSELHKFVLEAGELDSPVDDIHHHNNDASSKVQKSTSSPSMPTLFEEDEMSSPPKEAKVEQKKYDLEVEDSNAAVRMENKRLKEEIAAFDVEFFEQLEDLKYRYSRMQEIVGADPALTSHSKSPTKLPLDRLAWSVRNSITALDKASDRSQLVAGRSSLDRTTTRVPPSENKKSMNTSIRGKLLLKLLIMSFYY